MTIHVTKKIPSAQTTKTSCGSSMRTNKVAAKDRAPQESRPIASWTRGPCRSGLRDDVRPERTFLVDRRLADSVSMELMKKVSDSNLERNLRNPYGRLTVSRVSREGDTAVREGVEPSSSSRRAVMPDARPTFCWRRARRSLPA